MVLLSAGSLRITTKGTGKSKDNRRSFDFAQDDTVWLCERERGEQAAAIVELLVKREQATPGCGVAWSSC